MEGRGEELPGVVAVRQQRMQAKGVLERRRGLLLLRVAHHDVPVQVDHQRLYTGGAGDPRRPERGPGGLGALRPRHLPGPGPSGGDRGQFGVAESVQQPPTGGVRGHRPEQGRLVGQDRDVADRLGAVGDRHRQIDQHPPRIMPRPRPTHSV
jgi:hypothetical protein